MKTIFIPLFIKYDENKTTGERIREELHKAMEKAAKESGKEVEVRTYTGLITEVTAE